MEKPGPSPELPELKKLTARQKANFIRNKLEHFIPYDTKKAWEELAVELINPQILTWQGPKGERRLPPQRGVVSHAIYNKYVLNRQTTMPYGFMVDFTSTSQITGVNHAVFGPNAFEVTKDGRLIIDCSKAENPKGGIQAQLPNFFVDKVDAKTDLI